MHDAITQFLDLYKSLGLDGVPCSLADVAQVEHESGVNLPAAYIAYLLVAGRQPPKAWIGSSCSIVDLPGLLNAAEQLLAECQQPPLPEQAFVFAMHQGYQFHYFITDGNSEDPPVLYYLEGEPTTVMSFSRLSDLLAVVASDGKSEELGR